jgi:hypothetical protein
MGKKSRRQREKKNADNSRINSTNCPPFMLGTCQKLEAVRAAHTARSSRQPLGRVVAPLLTSRKVHPITVRLLGTERAYSDSELEWNTYKRAWDERNALVSADFDDGEALDEYLRAVVGNQFLKMGFGQDADGWGQLTVGKTMKYIVLDEAAVARWPRVKPHWRRFRRRLCTNCRNHRHLSEPRYLVCSGCGVARYCSEACQAADWPHHQLICCVPPMETRYADLKSDVNELEAMGIALRMGRPTLGASSVF